MNTVRLLTALACFAVAAEAKLLNLRDAPYAAAGDGIANDRPALAKAFADAKPGDSVLVPPGTYNLVLTGGALTLPEGVTLWGQTGQSTLLLATSGGTAYREFLRPAGGSTVDGLTVVRNADFSGVLIPLSGPASNVTIRNCRIVGNQARFPERACHAFRIGFGTVCNVVFENVAIEDCCYGLFQPNDATGTLDGFTVEHSRFERNTATDLEFNSPKGTLRNVVVRDCFFRDNRSRSPAGGFAVGFANVASGRVEHCMIRNYGSEALHVEDRSTDIVLAGNTIVGGSTRQPNGVILIVNDSRRVTIADNVIDARANTNSPHLILVTGGGKKFPCPSDVAVTGNVLVNGPTTRTWYLQDGSGPAPTANLILPEPPATKR